MFCRICHSDILPLPPGHEGILPHFLKWWQGPLSSHWTHLHWTQGQVRATLWTSRRWAAHLVRGGFPQPFLDVLMFPASGLSTLSHSYCYLCGRETPSRWNYTACISFGIRPRGAECDGGFLCLTWNHTGLQVCSSSSIRAVGLLPQSFLLCVVNCGEKQQLVSWCLGVG